MTEQSKYSFPNARKVQIIEVIDTYIENQGSSHSSEIRQALDHLSQQVSNLREQHPQVSSEQEAMAVIEAEFSEIKRSQPLQWKKLLQLRRWLNGFKSSSFSLGEHFAEESPWGKATIGFLQGFSDDV
ncbi:MAG: hypothetical protein AAFY72_06760 [Cyanobacteria bacterium J06649_4]